jgi:hypothetical protein
MTPRECLATIWIARARARGGTTGHPAARPPRGRRVIFIERQRDPRRERSGYLRAPRHPPGRSPSLVAVVPERRDQEPTAAHPAETRPSPPGPSSAGLRNQPKFISVNQSLRPQTDADHLRHRPARTPLLISCEGVPDYPNDLVEGG